MNVSLTPALEKFVEKKVKSGLYHTASEVIRDGLRLIEERDRLYKARLEALRRDIGKGLESGPATLFDPKDLKKRVRRVLSRRRKVG
jgi:antitoxin ParD1/3/4